MTTCVTRRLLDRWCMLTTHQWSPTQANGPSVFQRPVTLESLNCILTLYGSTVALTGLSAC